jgi:hypothetical protein
VYRGIKSSSFWRRSFLALLFLAQAFKQARKRRGISLHHHTCKKTETMAYLQTQHKTLLESGGYGVAGL